MWYSIMVQQAQQSHVERALIKKTSSIQAMIARDPPWIVITPRFQPNHSKDAMSALSAQLEGTAYGMLTPRCW